MPQSLGPYELIARLGSGGMATVYRARDTRDGRFVALKVLHDYRSVDEDYIRRFEQEAKLAARLQHPNIVRLYEAGDVGDQHYLAMELVEGETLATRLQTRRRLRPDEVRAIAIGVASALEDAHRQKVIHRDVKPANVLLGHDGSIKVSDFGIARSLDATSQTSTGTFLGSIAYASPEAIDGKADPRGDLYSLGVLLYQALLGHAPFEAQSAVAVMRMHERDAPPDLDRLRAVDDELGRIIERLLQKDPDDRYQSASHLLRALNAGGRGRGGIGRGAIIGGLGLVGGGAIAGGIVVAMLLFGGGSGSTDDATPTAVVVVGDETATGMPNATSTTTPGPQTQTVVADFKTSAARGTRTAVAPTRAAASATWGAVVQTSIAARTATVLAQTPQPTATPVGPGQLTVIVVPGPGEEIEKNTSVEMAVFFRPGADIENLEGTLLIRSGLGDAVQSLEVAVVTTNEAEGRAVLSVMVTKALTRVCGYEVTAKDAGSAVFECAR